MARPRVSRDMTTTVAARELGMSIGQLIRWVDSGVLPPPSRVDNNGVRYFDINWLEAARAIKRQQKGGNDG